MIDTLGGIDFTVGKVEYLFKSIIFYQFFPFTMVVHQFEEVLLVEDGSLSVILIILSQF